MSQYPLPPIPTSDTGRAALQAMRREGSLVAALQTFHQATDNLFQINLPRFHPIMAVGPEANHFILAQSRHHFLWRPEGDPVAKLLGHGVLVTDGDWHDQLRQQLNPALHKQQLGDYVEKMWRNCDRVTVNWSRGVLDMLPEMRKVALLILLDTLFGVDFGPDMARLWPAVLRLLRYISPGLWLLWPGMPRPGYAHAIQQMDDYLYALIDQQRAGIVPAGALLEKMLQTDWMNRQLIRDQLLTMLIAGHDTSTALLAWALYLLGKHPAALAQAQAEVDEICGTAPPTYKQAGRLHYLERVIKETLRLYPPIHLGMRRATGDLVHQGYRIPAGSRVLYSIYLTQRDPHHWPNATTFDPDRFLPGREPDRPTYSYVPFGGGPRNCIGAAYAQLEAKIVLARLLQQFHFQLTDKAVHPHLGATLEPRPGVIAHVTPRTESNGFSH